MEFDIDQELRRDRARMDDLWWQIAGLDAQILGKQMELNKAKSVLRSCQDLYPKCDDLYSHAANVGSMLAQVIGEQRVLTVPGCMAFTVRDHIAEAVAAAARIVSSLEKELSGLEKRKGELSQERDAASRKQDRDIDRKWIPGYGK
ncbi:hypothetical protein Corgl_0015 [Coriobacterium glomerans PW2]|uniref:Uncharacterized protein n=1 Tax=Coriobacterium glomerans (strain ATCC 49209 / DSM 20642 / JCM 10262 / PW2) TaxID=700015 RepID=F2N6U6_CORGP|nr:hypothetical protein [Coriobacterium glomerans]AEB06145.1 hypothetical protein Corgl_0015 [Coriobacterium glomerans PW2]